MNDTLRPLGKIRETVLSTGLDISYAYDDLVFSDNNVFILRFDEALPNRVYVYFNSDCGPKEARMIGTRLIASGRGSGFTIIHSGSFSVRQAEGREEITIQFHGPHRH